MKIKNCPFCGGKPYLERSHRAFIKAQTTRVAFVRCTECDARTGRVELSKYGNTSHSAKAEEEAIKLWNNRQPMQNIVKRLEKLTEIVMSKSEKAAELRMEKHTILEGAKGIAYETAIEIVKEEGDLNEE